MNKSFQTQPSFVEASNKITMGINKLIGKAKMAKRSAVIERVVTNLFPEVKDGTEQYATDVYEMINTQIMSMVIVGDIKQFEFSNRDGIVLDAMLVDQSLNLVPETGEFYFDDGEDGEQDEDSDVQENFANAKNTDSEDDAWDLLNSRSEGLLLISTTDVGDQSVTDTRVMESPEQALVQYLEAKSRPYTTANLYNLIPVEVEINLEFKNIFARASTNDGFPMEETVEGGKVHTTGYITQVPAEF